MRPAVNCISEEHAARRSSFALKDQTWELAVNNHAGNNRAAYIYYVHNNPAPRNEDRFNNVWYIAAP